MESALLLEDLILEFPETLSTDPAFTTLGHVNRWLIVDNYWHSLCILPSNLNTYFPFSQYSMHIYFFIP